MMLTISIAKSYTWEMGHALANHDGKCYHPHGHNYRLEVEVSGEVGEESGMVLDFAQLDDLMEPLIADNFDHKFLMNDTDERHHGGDLHPDFDVTTHPFEPTAENLAVKVWLQIEDFQRSVHAFEGVIVHAFEGVTLERVTIWETDRASATIRRS